MAALDQYDAFRNAVFEVSGTATDGSANADAIPSTEVNAARWISLHLVSAGFNGTLTFQGSNDNANWTSVVVENMAATGNGAPVFSHQSTGGSVNVVYAGALAYRYFRAHVTAYTSGSITVTAEFSALPSALHLIAGQMNVVGSVSHGSTDSGNPVKVGGKANDTAPATVAAGQRVDAWYDRRGRALVAASLASDSLTNNGAELTPVFAAIVASASGATQIVAADGTRKIRVLQYTFSANGAVNAKFQSAANDRTGLLYLGANGQVSVAFCPLGLFETAVNEALNLNLSGAVAVGGHLVYTLV